MKIEKEQFKDQLTFPLFGAVEGVIRFNISWVVFKIPENLSKKIIFQLKLRKIE